MNPKTVGTDAAATQYDGPERRTPEHPDRRAAPRGGRRATDTLTKIASFVYNLLTETPR